MNRNSSFFLVAGFLVAQMLSLWHMAEHSFEPHDHDGVVCDIYLLCEHTKFADTTAPVTLPEQSFTKFKTRSCSPSPFRTALFTGCFARAPPVFS